MGEPKLEPKELDVARMVVRAGVPGFEKGCPRSIRRGVSVVGRVAMFWRKARPFALLPPQNSRLKMGPFMPRVVLPKRYAACKFW